MKSKFQRFLFGALCAIFMLGLTPEMTVSATETSDRMIVVEQEKDGVFYYTEEQLETESVISQEMPKHEETISSLYAIEEKDGYTTFSTFEDLKELTSKTYNSYTYVQYVGNEDLIIKENITIPSNLTVSVYGVDMVVPAGVTLYMETNGGYLSVESLDVKGTVTVNGGLSVQKELNITGKVYVNSSLTMQGSAILTGADKIAYRDEWSRVRWNPSVYTMAELKKVISEATKCTDSHYVYDVNVRVEDDLLVDESLVVPSNVELSIGGQGTFTIEKGSQLSLSSYCYVSASVVVRGVLNNGKYISINRPNGSLSFAKGSSYTGSGYIYVYADDEKEFQAALNGLDMADFEVIEQKEYSHFWAVRSMAGLIRLGKPTELEWGYAHQQKWDYSTQSSSWVAEKLPGSISWKTAEPDQGQATIKVYREGETTPYQTHSWSFGSTSIPEWRSIDSFCNDDPESGTYYFTVQTTADYTKYYNSEIAQSGKWTYTKPNKKVDVPTNLRWTTWPNFTWDAPDSEYVDGYYIQLLYAATKDATPTIILSTWHRSDTVGGNVWQDRMMGDGYYYFKVRALSSDITVECNSEWSELSEPYVVGGLMDGVKEQLDEIASEATTPAEIREAVQAMDTQDLKDAMNSDNSNSDIIDKLAELEQAAGGAAPVDVSEDAEAFAAGDITVVGANLNSPASEEEPITLVIDKPEKDDVIPAAYDNSVAVKFSMTLDNVTDVKNLEVPVKITLPVPSTINPQFLVILHYHAADNSVEEIRPKVYNVGSQYYASFVLTSFSDFAMTQTAPKIQFKDVKAGAFYEEAVQWALKKGVTTGLTDTTFGPDQVCTRGQIVTFLWRAYGSPEPKGLKSQFKDVQDPNAYYYKAVLWAVENGITTGLNATTFDPDGACTRGQVVTFMWRAEGKPSNSVKNPFVDLKAGEYYCEPVLWAVENGITTGLTSTTFGPDETCTRGQIVTFLYRGMK